MAEGRSHPPGLHAEKPSSRKKSKPKPKSKEEGDNAPALSFKTADDIAKHIEDIIK